MRVDGNLKAVFDRVCFLRVLRKTIKSRELIISGVMWNFMVIC
jgi:hypothetical protein